MTKDNRQDRAHELQDQIENTINRFVAEWNVTLAEAVGVLEIIKIGLMMENVDDGEEEDEEA